jgi:hypothetical protein
MVCALVACAIVVHLAYPAPVAAAASASAIAGELAESQMTFAYTDGSGKRLLGFESRNPKRFVQAIFAPGQRLTVKYAKHQKGTEDSTGRQTEWNFDKDQGELYKLAQGKIARNESVLLAEKNAFQGHEFLKVKAVKSGSLSKTLIRKIEKEKKRKVASQGLIGLASANVQIGIVVFEKVAGKKPLASLVLATKSELIFEDFVGNDDDQSTWRVDDGGVLTPGEFKILFATRSKAGYALGFEWYGAEGSSLKVIQQKGKKFRNVLEGYRYTMPV